MSYSKAKEIHKYPDIQRILGGYALGEDLSSEFAILGQNQMLEALRVAYELGFKHGEAAGEEFFTSEGWDQGYSEGFREGSQEAYQDGYEACLKREKKDDN